MSRLSDFLYRNSNHVLDTRERQGSHALHAGAWPETFINPKDGSTMRLIPSGEFTMGSTKSDVASARRMGKDSMRFSLTDEMPQFDLFVPGFYLSVFAITNKQFARFLTEMRPGPALFDLWVYAPAHLIRPDCEDAHYRVERGFDQHPAVHITWFGAQAYCRWANLRLPTEIEWEKAARGTDARMFPWGNEWRHNFLRWNRKSHTEDTATVEVNAYLEGCSPYGIVQMAGNVAEWCEDWYQPQAYTEHALGDRCPPLDGDEKVLRGGSCTQWRKLEFRCAMRQASTPVFTSLDFTGIRCACDLPGVAL